jgi:hypothetical protein
MIEAHLQALKERGIDEQGAKIGGLRSVKHHEAVQLMEPAYNTTTEEWAGFFIPYFNPISQQLTEEWGRVRLDHPLTRENRSVKYIQPRSKEGEPPKIYFTPVLSHYDRKKYTNELEAKLIRRPIPLFVVEGELKALSLALRIGWDGLVVGLGGVEAWSKKKVGYSKTRVLAPGFDSIGFEGREVFICFDSDVLSNRHVARAEKELAWAIKQQKKPQSVRLITVPTLDDGGKQGLDDWLASKGLEWEEPWERLVSEASYKRVKVPTPVDIVTFNRTPVKKAEIYCGTENVAYIVNGSVAFVHAASGVGKSYFTLQLANSLANGRAFLGHRLFDCPAPRKVILLQAEMPDAWWQPRTQKLETIFGETNPNLLLINDRFSLAENDKWGNFIGHFEILETLVKQHRPEVVILDPLSGYYDLAESSTDLNRKFMARLTGMAIRLGVAVVIVHHDRKHQSGESMHSMRGSSAFTDWATSVFGLRPAMDEDHAGKPTNPSPTDIELRIEKCRLANGPKPDALRLQRINSSSFFEIKSIDDADNAGVKGECKGPLDF